MQRRRKTAIKNIFLDLDDTLFPTSEFAELARKNALRAMIEQGLELDQKRAYQLLLVLLKKKGSNYSRIFDELCKELHIRRPARYIAAAVAAYHNTKSSILPYPEVPTLLLRLREKGFRLYIATNGDAIKQWDKLIRMGIELYFDDVFVSDEVGEEKSERFFRTVAKAISSTPSECVMVGDREDADIVPAKKAGFMTIRVRRGKHAEGKTAADYDVKDLRKLERYLDRLWRVANSQTIL